MATPLTVDQLNTIAAQVDYKPVGGSFSSTGLPTTSVSSPISVSGLTTTQAPLDTSGYQSTAIPSLQDIYTQYGTSPDVTTAQNKENATLGSIKSLTEQLGTKSAEQTRLESEAGVPGLNSQLNDINTTIRNYVAQAGQAKLTAENRLAPTFNISGEQAQIDRQLSMKTLGLSAAADAIGGQLGLAQDKVTRALAAEFDHVDAEIKYYQSVLGVNQDNLSTAQQKQATRLQQALADRQNQIDQQRQDRTQVYNTITTLLGKGVQIPTSVISQAMSANPQQALALISPYANVSTYDTITQNGIVYQVKRDASGKIIGTPTPVISSSNGNYVADPTASPQVQNKGVLTALLQSPKIGQTTRTNIANVLGVIGSLNDLASPNQTGNITGVNPFSAFLNAKIPFTNLNLIPFRETFKQAGSIKNEQLVNAVNLKLQQWASGASLTTEQTRQVQRMSPTMSDTDANFRTKINGLTNLMLSLTSSQLQSEGITFTPAPVDLFKTTSTDQYAQFRSQLQPGEILVNRNGQATAVNF